MPMDRDGFLFLEGARVLPGRPVRGRVCETWCCRVSVYLTPRWGPVTIRVPCHLVQEKSDGVYMAAKAVHRANICLRERHPGYYLNAATPAMQLG